VAAAIQAAAMVIINLPPPLRAIPRLLISKSSNIDFFRYLFAAKTPELEVAINTKPPCSRLYSSTDDRNTTEQDYANKVNNAILQINTKLRNVLVLEPVSVKPANENFIQISHGTSYNPQGPPTIKATARMFQNIRVLEI
jgi:hypothetical protein